MSSRDLHPSMQGKQQTPEHWNPAGWKLAAIATGLVLATALVNGATPAMLDVVFGLMVRLFLGAVLLTVCCLIVIAVVVAICYVVDALDERL